MTESLLQSGGGGDGSARVGDTSGCRLQLLCLTSFTTLRKKRGPYHITLQGARSPTSATTEGENSVDSAVGHEEMIVPLEPHFTDSVRVQGSVISIVSCWSIASQSHRESSTVDTVLSGDNKKCHQHTKNFQKKKKRVVAEQVLQSTECPGRKDLNLQVLIQLICSCQEERLAAVECRRQSSRHHNQQHQ